MNIFDRLRGTTAEPKPSNTASLSSADVFIKVALEQFANSKESKKLTNLKEASKLALTALEASSGHPNPSHNTLKTIFSPFQIACQTRIPFLVSVSIDCLGKLFPYNYWGKQEDIEDLADNELDETSPTNAPVVTPKQRTSQESSKNASANDVSEGSIMPLVVDTICDAFSGGDSTDEKVQLQIVKSLSVSICTSDPQYAIHGTTLLKAIRTTYNIFLTSKTPNTQIVAQATLAQMIQAVFGRVCTIRPESPVKCPEESPSKDTESFISANSKHSSPVKKPDELLNSRDASFDVYFKDAYLVFRALCKLSMKPVPSLEAQTDLRSTPMRSKLLSLHLIHSALCQHLNMFLMPAPILFTSSTNQEDALFIHAIKQYLCLALSRNSSNPMPAIFDISIEIFSRLLYSLRAVLKKELAVLFTEILLPILEAKNTVTYYQRMSLIRHFNSFLVDSGSISGKILVELYLNYDCDVTAGAKENIWERLALSLAKIIGNQDQQQPVTTSVHLIPHTTLSINGVIPAITTGTLISYTKEQVKELYSADGEMSFLKMNSVELVRTILKSLSDWISLQKQVIEAEEQKQLKESTLERNQRNSDEEVKLTKKLRDDPVAFENMRQKKQIVVEGVKQFNQKPKKGIAYLIENKYIKSSEPVDIAKFLLSVEGIDKKALGEYLGEGEEVNIAIMHSFVDQMDFTNLSFVDALRQFLQHFRLPGEAQKIDRFMLKFAERYLNGNPSSFSSADTAYVLAYSVIMLNTDQHNTQVKKKMIKQDFIKNNRGIDSGKDLPSNILEEIFDDIANHEIVLNDEQALKHAVKAETMKPSKLNQMTIASEAMALNTEARFNNLMSKQKISEFIVASHYEHVKQMFQLVWIGIQSSLCTAFQELHDPIIIGMCMDGFRMAVRICCIFDLESERKSFISSLSKFCQVNAISQMRPSNLEAIITLLDIAYAEGNFLQDSWMDIITCISQLERFQLLGNDEELQRIQRLSSEYQRNGTQNEEASSQSMTVAVDKIFTATTKLSGTAIVEFVKALCTISWDEISNSVDQDHPKMYSLQRLIEISFYNMNRIRVEWSNIWAVLGDHFNQVASHSNPIVALFALDKMRQLAIKFLDIEELSNFKFQKDFLKPFEHAISSSDLKIKDMVLICLQQMIQAKPLKLKSGWKTIFATFARAAREPFEQISHLTFDIVKNVYKNNFDSFVSNSAFSDFTACLVEFCKNKNFVKTSLQAIEILKSSIPRMIENLDSKKPEQPHTPVKAVAPDEDPNFKFWFPVLFGFYEIIMTCELEVRTRGLNYLFETLKQFGDTFPRDFWEVVSKGVLFPIFDDLKLSNQEHNKYTNREDMSVWLSTTMIQALRLFIDLYSHFFTSLEFMLSDVLKILERCLTQDNETLARIGSTCMHQFCANNAQKFSEPVWEQVCDKFSELFAITTPSELLFDMNDSAEAYHEQQIIDPVGLGLEHKEKPKLQKRPEKEDFQKIITKCVLHLLLIQTLNDVFDVDSGVYPFISSKNMLKLLDCLDQSFIFARDFNQNMELRTLLYRMGFMKQMPNLLKQETSSVSTFITVLFRMYSDESRLEVVEQVEEKLIPLSLDLLKMYNSFDPESNKRDVNAWRPVILLVLSGLELMQDDLFKKQIPQFYDQVVELTLHELPIEFRQLLHSLLLKTARLFEIYK